MESMNVHVNHMSNGEHFHRTLDGEVLRVKGISLIDHTCVF